MKSIKGYWDNIRRIFTWEGLVNIKKTSFWWNKGIMRAKIAKYS